jgi:L-alanine-DL-glutamate epimerase-like enolase superfamily enzyme
MDALGLVRLFTDDGVEGNSLIDAAHSEEFVRRFHAPKRQLNSPDSMADLLGSDPFDRERIEKSVLSQYFWQPTNNSVVCALDECLWDIVGKALKLPIYKLLGAYRERILAYASTPEFEEEDDYVDLTLDCQRRGFRAIKIHPLRHWKRDIALCRAVREAVGEEMILMLDSFNAYNHDEALRVGRELDKLNFYWYEDPILDMRGLAGLCRSLQVKIVMGELLSNLWDYGEYIVRGATDALRCIDVRVGGITPMLKIAHLAEVFGMTCELDSWGSTLAQAAHLHAMLAIKNCDFFEQPVPEGVFDLATKDKLRIDAEGYVHAPKKPGLGLEIDWDEVEKITDKTLP